MSLELLRQIISKKAYARFECNKFADFLKTLSPKMLANLFDEFYLYRYINSGSHSINTPPPGFLEYTHLLPEGTEVNRW